MDIATGHYWSLRFHVNNGLSLEVLGHNSAGSLVRGAMRVK